MTYRSKKPYLICYDISNPKRLGRLHRYISKHAIPVQYSVYLAMLKQNQLDEIKQGIGSIINNHRDDVRIYPLPSSPAVNTLGNQLLPEGISLLYNGVDLTLKNS